MPTCMQRELKFDVSSVLPQKSTLKLVRLADRNAAVGAAARLMMGLPSFQQQNFAQVLRALDAQAERGHQLFALEQDGKLAGYIGYALANEDLAEAWLKGSSLLSTQCCVGDCIIFNYLIAADTLSMRFLWNACRKLSLDKKAGYYKRAYPDGSVRPVRLRITPLVQRHVDRNAQIELEN